MQTVWHLGYNVLPWSRRRLQKSPEDRVERGPELFIDLVGPVGINLKALSQTLEEAFSQVKYETKTLHIIENIHLFQRWKDLPEDKVEERYTSHIKAGDEFREAFKLGDALTRLSMHIIREQYRKKRSVEGDSNEPIPRCAYIFRSLKHPHEVKLLRDTYGPNFYLIAAYSPRETRLRELTKQIGFTSLNRAGRDALRIRCSRNTGIRPS
jgi:cytidine deaminase